MKVGLGMNKEDAAKRLKELDDESRKLYDEEEKIKDELKIIAREQVLSSGLLKQYEWDFYDNYCMHDNFITFKAIDCCYWDELEELLDSSKYHWRDHLISKEVYVGGNDGDILLHIRYDVMKKWITQLGIKIHIDKVVESLVRSQEQILKLQTKIKLLEELKSFLLE